MTAPGAPGTGEDGPGARSVYLGPGRGRWAPGSHAEVIAAAAGGLLDEGHHVELKREIAAGPAANKELGRDLASCAVDGGLIVVGITDDSGRAGTVVDVDLPGLAERVDQVARRITPPLSVLCRDLSNPDKPGRGVLLVEIPPSPDAPHMADERYWGRGDRTEHTLADAEVRELIAARSRARADARVLLDRFIDAEASAVAGNSLGTLFVLAVPSTPRVDAVADYLYAPRAAGILFDLAKDVSVRVEQVVGRFDPNLRSQLVYHRRADGVGLRTDSGPPGNQDWPALLQVQLGSDGTVRLVSGRGTDLVASGSGERLAISVPTAAGLLRSVLAIAAALADQAGYDGTWTVAIGVDGLQGAIDSSRAGGPAARYAPSYPDGDYQRTTTATTAELADTPGAVTGRLLLGLLRVLDAVETHQKLLNDPGRDGA